MSSSILVGYSNYCVRRNAGETLHRMVPNFPLKFPSLPTHAPKPEIFTLYLPYSEMGQYVRTSTFCTLHASTVGMPTTTPHVGGP